MNTLQKLLLVLGIACMGMSPVVAMDHISGVKRQAEDDGREEDSKRPRQGDIEEVIKLDEVQPRVDIDWDDIIHMMDEHSDYKGVVEKYGSSFSVENEDFERLLIVALEANVGFDQMLQPIVDLIEKSGPDILKYMIRAHQRMGEPCPMFSNQSYYDLKELLQLKKVQVCQSHIMSTMYLHNKALLDLLLNRVPVDFINERVMDQRWCQWVLEVIHGDDTINWLESFLKRGYQVTHFDVCTALDQENFRSFSYLLFYVKRDNFAAVFNSPTGGYDDLLYEILERGLGAHYVQLLLDRDNVPPCDFGILSNVMVWNYTVFNGVLDVQGDAILRLIGNHLKIQDYRNEFARIVNAITERLGYIEHDNGAELEKFLLHGGSPNQFIGHDRSYVCHALEHNSIGCLNLLLAHGAELDAHGTVFDSENYMHYSEPVKTCINYHQAVQFLNRFDGCTGDVQISQLPVGRFLADYGWNEGLQGGVLAGFYQQIANNPYQTLRYLENDEHDKMSQIKLMLRYPKVAESLIFSTLYKWFRSGHRKNIRKKVDNQLIVQENVPNEVFIINELQRNCEKELECNRGNDYIQGRKAHGFLKENVKDQHSTHATHLYTWYVFGEKLKERLCDAAYSDVVVKTQE